MELSAINGAKWDLRVGKSAVRVWAEITPEMILVSRHLMTLLADAFARLHERELYDWNCSI